MRKFVLFLTVFLVAIALLLWTFSDTDSPIVTLSPDLQVAGNKQVFYLETEDQDSNIASIEVKAVQNGKERVILEKTFKERSKAVKEEFTLESSGIVDGPFILTVTVKDSSFWWFGEGNVTEVVKTLQMDTTPPSVQVLTIAHNIRAGGSAFVVFNASKPLSQGGVVSGKLFFPAFKQANGNFYCLFALPINVDPKEYNPKILVVDEAANERIVPLSCRILPRKFRQDTINVSDKFLQDKMPQYQEYYPERFPANMPLVEIYLKVNNDMRQENAKILKELSLKTAQTPLWTEPFLRMPDSKPMARFGDRRSYLRNGKKIDEQTHMGEDLASLKHAKIPAGNNGKVVLARFFGIYGLTVILDHGLGLQSIYSHLSQITVKEGEEVKRGDLIGYSGETGLAGGDHLHFGIIVHGVEVSPVEWWDAHWIKDNVSGKYQ